MIFHSSSSVFGLKSKLKKLQIPKIYYFHSPWQKEYEITQSGIRNKSFLNFFASLFRKWHESIYLQLSDGIVTLSESMRREMLVSHKNISGYPYKILPGAADQEVFYPSRNKVEKMNIRKSLGLSRDDIYIIVSRRLIDRTGIDILLEGFSLMLGKYSDSFKLKQPKLIITGRGNRESFYKELCCKLNLDKSVIFTGYVAENVLGDYYRASDLFIIPTKYLEGFGLATVEAMATGLPVIGTPVGGTEEILLQLDSKLLISSITPESIAEKIYFMLNENLSLWSKKTLNFYKEKYSWEKHSRCLRSFINEINNSHR